MLRSIACYLDISFEILIDSEIVVQATWDHRSRYVVVN
jgi:hypothetical protein